MKPLAKEHPVQRLKAVRVTIAIGQVYLERQSSKLWRAAADFGSGSQGNTVYGYGKSRSVALADLKERGLELGVQIVLEFGPVLEAAQ
jgi:hypothetical protein